MDRSAYMRAGGVYDSSHTYPLVGSQNIRVFIQDMFSGTSSLDTIQPGGHLK